MLLFCIPKILKNESNSQLFSGRLFVCGSCFVSQRYWKMKAIHNYVISISISIEVVLYPKDTEKWKQFTTPSKNNSSRTTLFCIPKILKNESNSQPSVDDRNTASCCFVSQRYWKMKAIHNPISLSLCTWTVVLYPKDTEKWKQFTTNTKCFSTLFELFCIPKILKNESNSQQKLYQLKIFLSCFVSQRYWKMKAIHNSENDLSYIRHVVLYPKDTEKWKQFTTYIWEVTAEKMLFCIPKILKNESNSQH